MIFLTNQSQTDSSKRVHSIAFPGCRLRPCFRLVLPGPDSLPHCLHSVTTPTGVFVRGECNDGVASRTETVTRPRTGNPYRDLSRKPVGAGLDQNVARQRVATSVPRGQLHGPETQSFEGLNVSDQTNRIVGFGPSKATS